ncbi:MAG: DUF1294 domain-containing protein [Sulfuricurvum sp.]|nr:DUF1294 domain-containing protein [Sulfuricurvum sp.]
MNYLLYIFLSLNAITLIAFGVDKYLAISNRYRISEKNLLFWALIGGSVGAIAAQRLFRHKTQKFKYVLWMILSVHSAIGWFLWNRYFH